MSTEFVKQTLRDNLGRVLVPHVADGLWSIYDNAKIACERNNQPEKTLQTFQNLLTRIPQWTDDTIAKEIERIAIVSKCDYIEDLLLGVFVSYIRAFASLQQVESNSVQVEFDRPSLNKFVHAMYISTARKSWSNAYLYKTIGVTGEQQARNRREIETLMEQCLHEVIDGFIPWKDISRAYFQARSDPVAAPKPPPAAPKPSLSFGGDETVEFETDDEEEDEEEDRPRISLGEDMALNSEDIGGDTDSVDTATELEQKVMGEIVSWNM